MEKFFKKDYSFERVKSAREGDVVYVDKGDYFDEVVISSTVKGRKWHDLSRPYETVYRMKDGNGYWVEEIFKIKNSNTRSCDVSSPPERTEQQKFEDMEKLRHEINKQSYRTPLGTYRDR